MPLFVFAHQDDEIAFASRILFEVRSGRRVRCICLTDGGPHHTTRNLETLGALTSLGVAADDVAFTSTIPDGSLVEHLDEALERVENFASSQQVDSVYCLAWEGGHQDHDASQLVAVAFAKRHGLLDRCFEMPLYRGWWKHLFRVMSPMPGAADWQRRRISFRDGLRVGLLATRYRSQRLSWLGLFPETFLKFAVMRRELVRHVDSQRVRARPHAGALFYEGRFRFPYERFVSASARFITDRC